MIPIFARMNGLTPVAVPLTPSTTTSTPTRCSRRDARDHLPLLAEQPDRHIALAAAIERVVERAPGVVILDEAYAEFARRDLSPIATRERARAGDAHAVQGVRAGRPARRLRVGAPALVAEVEKARGPYKVSALAERAALAALGDGLEWVRDASAEASRNRERLTAELRRAGFASAAVGGELRPRPDRATPMRRARHMRELGVAVRPFNGLPRRMPARRATSGAALRIGVGPWEHDEARARRARCDGACDDECASTLFDYGAGNLHSLAKALAAAAPRCASRPIRARAIDTDVLVLPGVGAFARAAERLAPALDAMRARDRGRPAVPRHLPRHAAALRRERRGRRARARRHSRPRRAHHASPRVPQIGWNSVERSPATRCSRRAARHRLLREQLRLPSADERVVTAWTSTKATTASRRPCARGARSACSSTPRRARAPASRCSSRSSAEAHRMIAIPAVDLREAHACSSSAARTPTSASASRSRRRSRASGRDARLLAAARRRSRRGDRARLQRRASCATLIGSSDIPCRWAAAFAARTRSSGCSSDGAEYVVVGTRAIEEPRVAAERRAPYPGADHRRRGRARAARRDARLGADATIATSSTSIDELNDSPLAAVLVTAVHREGQMHGTDLSLMEDVAEPSAFRSSPRAASRR